MVRGITLEVKKTIRFVAVLSLVREESAHVRTVPGADGRGHFQNELNAY